MLTVATGTTEAVAVADAAARCFAKLGETVVSMPLAALLATEVQLAPSVPSHLQAVVAPDLRRVESAVGAGDLVDFAPLAHALGGAEWQVVVLVPAPAAGEAHRSLRGTPALIQPWWFDDDGQHRFGRPEIA